MFEYSQKYKKDIGRVRPKFVLQFVNTGKAPKMLSLQQLAISISQLFAQESEEQNNSPESLSGGMAVAASGQRLSLSISICIADADANMYAAAAEFIVLLRSFLRSLYANFAYAS